MAMHEIKTLIAIYRTGNVEIQSHIAFCAPCLLIHNDDDCFKYLLWDTRIATLQTPWANLKLARTCLLHGLPLRQFSTDCITLVI